MMLSRRSLVHGRLERFARPLRPPWALAPGAFEDACTRDDACVRACPERIVVRGDGGFPEVDFSRGGCTFCGACTDACTSGALERSGRAPWTLAVTVGEACIARGGVECRVCVDWCDAGALRAPPASRPGAPVVDPTRCTHCGACVKPCPVDALSLAPNGVVGHA